MEPDKADATLTPASQGCDHNSSGESESPVERERDAALRRMCHRRSLITLNHIGAAAVLVSAACVRCTPATSASHTNTHKSACSVAQRGFFHQNEYLDIRFDCRSH